MERVVEERLDVKRQSDADRGGQLPLTERERQVLTRIARGMTNPQIAQDLQLSVPTIKQAVTHLLRKLALPGRVEAAVYAAREGLLDSEAEQETNGGRK